MALSSFVGVNFTNYGELCLFAVQLLCFANAYYVTIVLLGPLSFLLILFITLLYSRALLALQLANSTHLAAGKDTEGSRYCRKCGYYVVGRDHHCLFTGRCVEKANYVHFLSYIFYAYLLSCHTLFALLR
jgi:hypothetical protein